MPSTDWNPPTQGQVEDPVADLEPFWKRIMLSLFWLGTISLTTAFVLAMFARSWWFADLFTHFRVQGFFLGFLLLSIAVSQAYWKPALLVAMLVIAQGVMIAPYLLPRQKTPLPDSAASLMVWNVLIHNQNHAGILSLIREQSADIVILLEVSHELGRELGQLHDLYPVQEFSPSLGPFGSGILSKKPLQEITIRQLGQELESTIIARLDNGTTILGVHALPPRGARYSRIRNQQLDDIAEFASKLTGPVIVAGDLNATPWSPHFQDLLREASLRDPRRGRGLLTSWPQGKPLIRIPIDHFLPSDEVRLEGLRILPETEGSDHHPVVCRWILEREFTAPTP